MPYMFRKTFRIPPGNRIDHDGSELVLRDGPMGRVAIKPRSFDRAIRDEDRFALRGEGYRTEQEAQEDGERWAAALALGLVSELVPPDFESRRPWSQFPQSTLDQMSASISGEARVFSEQSGLQVVEEGPRPIWAGMEVRAEANRSAPAAIAAIRRAYEDQSGLDDKTSLAIDLFSAAESVAEDADARFLMLMFAVEAMIDVHPRHPAQAAAVSTLLETLDAFADLDNGERRELADALRGLRRESIGSAGRRLASTLDPRLYDGRPASRFFRDAYNIRSKLVHGNAGEARPSIETVRALQGPMLWFVRDLILTRAGLHLPHPLDSARRDDPTG